MTILLFCLQYALAPLFDIISPRRLLLDGNWFVCCLASLSVCVDWTRHFSQLFLGKKEMMPHERGILSFGSLLPSFTITFLVVCRPALCQLNSLFPSQWGQFFRIFNPVRIWSFQSEHYIKLVYPCFLVGSLIKNKWRNLLLFSAVIFFRGIGELRSRGRLKTLEQSQKWYLKNSEYFSSLQFPSWNIGGAVSYIGGVHTWWMPVKCVKSHFPWVTSFGPGIHKAYPYWRKGKSVISDGKCVG